MKKFLSTALLAACLLFSFCGLLSAEIFENKDCGVSIWLPDNWEADSDEDGVLSADAPEGDSFCLLQVLLEENELDAALEAYGDALAEEVDNFKVIQPARQSELNGMKVDLIKGQGERDDKTWSIDVALISTDTSVLLLIVGCEKGKENRYASLHEKIIDSITKLE